MKQPHGHHHGDIKAKEESLSENTRRVVIIKKRILDLYDKKEKILRDIKKNKDDLKNTNEEYLKEFHAFGTLLQKQKSPTFKVGQKIAKMDSFDTKDGWRYNILFGTISSVSDGYMRVESNTLIIHLPISLATQSILILH